jgi:hypothetical protein
LELEKGGAGGVVWVGQHWLHRVISQQATGRCAERIAVHAVADANASCVTAAACSADLNCAAHEWR